MNARVIFLVLLATLGLRLAAADATPAPATDRSAARGGTLGFDAFRIVSERNIFDPNRTGRSARSGDPAPRADILSLVGTMHYEKGLYAFFDGSGPTFQKALHEGEPIADYTVTRITQDSVALARSGQSTTLAIGQQLRRPVGGDWSAAEPVTVRAEPDPGQAADAPAPTTNPTPTSSTGSDDVLKRLMDQRQKKLKP